MANARLNATKSNRPPTPSMSEALAKSREQALSRARQLLDDEQACIDELKAKHTTKGEWSV